MKSLGNIIDSVIKTVFRIDTRTPEEKVRDGIRKMVEEEDKTKVGRIVTRSTVYPDYRNSSRPTLTKVQP